MTASNIPSARPGRLLQAVLLWTSLTTLVFWLPTVRGAFDGEGYTWNALGFSGNGTSGAYWFPVLGSIGSLSLLFMAWRGIGRAFPFVLMGWHVFLTIGLAVVAATDPEGFYLEGDTVGMRIDLGLIGTGVLGAWTLLAAWACWRDFRSHATRQLPEWTRSNTRRSIALIALMPIQLLLLYNGTTDAVSDVIGVCITVLQWLVLGWAVRPQ